MDSCDAANCCDSLCTDESHSQVHYTHATTIGGSCLQCF